MDIINNINTPEELLDYMNKNIQYGFVSKSGKKYIDVNSHEWNDWFTECTIQSGEEVLESNIGTCWDQVELERLWFEKHNYIFKTFFMYYKTKKDNNYPTHTFLVYKSNGRYYWFEHAFELYKGIHEFANLNDLIEFIKEKQNDYLKSNFKNVTDDDINSLVVNEYTKPADNLGVEEYLNHVTNNRL